MAEPVKTQFSIEDESIYYRLDLLKKGLVQFTDATTAARLLREHGRDIRYNAAWKKWVVWEKTHWQMDDGALIHEKGLEMVRNIYNDLLKTADYRDRMEIEKYAMLSESVRRREAFVPVRPQLRERFCDPCFQASPWLKPLIPPGRIAIFRRWSPASIILGPIKPPAALPA
jgi:putative DNA primase/helicase